MANLKDRLSHFTYREACRLLGPEGERLIRAGGKYEVEITENVTLMDDLFRVKIEDAIVTISLSPEKPKHLKIGCNICSGACEHMGAAFSLILEEKLSLGLSAPPPEKKPVESLSDADLVKLAIEERAERAEKERMQIKSMDSKTLWTDYAVTSHTSGKSYRVALRGWERGDSYCSCPDFRKNTLGICKHILYALQEAKKRFSKTVRETPYQIRNIGVHLKYDEETELRVLVPDNLDHRTMSLIRPLRNRPVENVKDLLHRVKEVGQNGHEVTIYPDAEEYINSALYPERIRDKMAEIRKDPEESSSSKNASEGRTLPYQLDGIAFAVGAGRAVLADDMGLGKTIQGIGVAELLSHEAGISKVLVICPASVKSQWRLEMMRFSNRSHQLVLGSAKERAAQYNNPCFLHDLQLRAGSPGPSFRSRE